MRQLKKSGKNQDLTDLTPLTEYLSVPPYVCWAVKQMSYEVTCHKLGNYCGIFSPIQECMSNIWNKSCFDQGMIATNGVILGLLLVCGFVAQLVEHSTGNTHRDIDSNPVKAGIVSGFFLWNFPITPYLEISLDYFQCIIYINNN